VIVPGVDALPTKAPIHPNLEVQRSLGLTTKTRRTFIVNGSSPSIQYRAHNSNITNLERAVNERVFYVAHKGEFREPPRPRSDGFFATQLGVFNALLSTHLFKTTPISGHEFAQLYTGRRKDVYTRAADSLLQGETLTQRDAEIRCFVKAEKINFSAKSDPTPRVISPRTPRFNVELGKYLRPIEDRLYKAIAMVFGEKVVFKGMNAVQQGGEMKAKWDKYMSPVAVGLDASRFDQHVSIPALRWEHSVYERCFRDPVELRKLLRMQLVNVVRGYCGDGNLKYKTQGGRMSGDMNTSLGNCLLMCAMVYSYCISVGVSKFSLANNGDDCVVIMEQEDLERFTLGLDSWFVDMGFSMKVEEPVFEFEGIEFCQTKPVLGPRGYTMTRCMTALGKDSVSLIPLTTQKEYEQWLSAVGQGGLSLASGMPVWQSFYQSMLRASNGARARQDDQQTGFKMLGAGLLSKASHVTQKARYSFYLAFGVTPDMQLALEAYYNNLNLNYAPPSTTTPLKTVPWEMFSC
jgi:hypothetical protein